MISHTKDCNRGTILEKASPNPKPPMFNQQGAQSLGHFNFRVRAYIRPYWTHNLQPSVLVIKKTVDLDHKFSRKYTTKHLNSISGTHQSN